MQISKLVAVLIAAVVVGAAASAVLPVTIQGWATSDGEVTVYTADGVPIRKVQQSAIGRVVGIHSWNRRYDLVQIGDVWIGREQLIPKLCEPIDIAEKMPAAGTNRTSPSTGRSSGTPC